jgi:hypothetical protein
MNKSKKELEAIREGTCDAWVGLYHGMAGFHMSDAIREGTRDAILELKEAVREGTRDAILELFEGAAACDEFQDAVRAGTRDAVKDMAAAEQIKNLEAALKASCR